MSRTIRYTELGDALVDLLNEEMDIVDRRVSQLERAKSKTFVTKISAAGAQVQHSLGRKPVTLSVALRGDARWWEYRDRDDNALYLKSSADVDAEVTVT